MLELPSTPSCYFCDLIDGRRDPWNLIERNDATCIVLNARQYEVGQCMVVPLRHAPTLLELSDGEAAAVMAAAKRVAAIMLEVFAPAGILLYQNNGVGSGQEVPHFHLHIVPRRPGSAWGPGPPQLADVETAARPAELDHEIATAEKHATVARLKRQIAAAAR